MKIFCFNLKHFGQIFSLRSNQKGMTLIEIVIVTSIIVGLFTLVSSQIFSRQNKAKYHEAKLRMAQVGRALDMYYTDCNKYPSSIQGLITKDDCSNWGPESYLKSEKDLTDSWGTPFEYFASGNTYELRSLGSDKREGGEGYAADITSND